MTTEPLDTPDAAPAEPASSAPGAGRRLGRNALMIVAGLLGGGGFGMFVTGPLVATRASTAAAAAVAVKPAAEKKEKKEENGEEERRETDLPVYVLDNIVLNPAESGGLRFLLLSITLEMNGHDRMELVKSHDAEIRELVLVSLSRRTVDVLADVRNREQLKEDIKSGLNVLLNGDAVAKVIFSQYVIQ